MDFFQFFGYFYVDQCGITPNETITTLSYLHMAFQPIFFNMLYIYFHGNVKAKTKKYIYAIAFAMSLILLVKFFPIAGATPCTIGQTLCGTNLCTISGNWHIGWSVPLYDFPFPGDPFIYYAFAVFIVPLFYGAWHAALFAAIWPILAYVTTQNPHEWPAVWCLMSVPIILIAIIHHVKNTRSYT
jgi:hypothetical protein